MIIILSKVTSNVNSSDLHLPYIKVEVGRFSYNSKSTLQNVVLFFLKYFISLTIMLCIPKCFNLMLRPFIKWFLGSSDKPGKDLKPYIL